MSKKIIIFLALIAISLAVHHRKKSFLKKSSFENLGCERRVYIQNKQTKLYLAPTTDVYNTNGWKVGTSVKPHTWCLTPDLYILDTHNGYALDVAFSDLEKKEIITWPQHDTPTQNQKWTRTPYFDNQNSYKLSTQTYGSNLVLNVASESSIVTLTSFELKNNYQNWDFVDPVEQYLCNDRFYIKNKGTGQYLYATSTVYNYLGYEVKVSPTPISSWCFTDDLYIIHSTTNYVLDVAEADLSKRQVIVWPLHEDFNGNQKWTHVEYFDNENALKISTQTHGSNLALNIIVGFVENIVTLEEFNLKKDLQNWTLEKAN